ncbi:MAG: hypothetical protein V1768_03850 [Patescibacteria group bacterium]|nr:hypothetical protein [Patescibacteria group bacterium]MBU1160422.1 hypothetical protein [Patescibacteria group bacterium]MBU1684121.1 hypothetical protein [Patescibacteria group bacterium]MBU1987610.1 hypothetical protein [Patescibacteria group bacterium]MBU2416100.1 hypothetical protein [Patescibacteria group bacterium]
MLKESNFIGQVNNQDADQEKKEKEIFNTTEFRNALDQGSLFQAENFLQNVANNSDQFPQYDERWVDHRQRELFQAFYQAEDWSGAKRLVEATKDERSKDGRKKRLQELSGMKYEEI